KPTTRPRTYLSYRERINKHVVPNLGKLSLPSLAPQHLQRLYAVKLETGLSTSTVNGIHVVVHRALKQALRWGLVARNVADAAEIGTFLEAIRGDRYAPLWITFLATGLRFGEAAALRWTDVDLEARAVAVRHTITRIGNKGFAFTEPKTASSRRTIPLPHAAF